MMSNGLKRKYNSTPDDMQMALNRAFNVTSDDLYANQEGLMTQRQARQLFVSFLVPSVQSMAPMLPALVIFLSLALVMGIFFLILVGLVILVSLVLIQRQVRREQRAGVQHLTGKIRKITGGREILVDILVFNPNFWQRHALKEGVIYTLHYSTHSRRILSAEVAEDSPMIHLPQAKMLLADDGEASFDLPVTRSRLNQVFHFTDDALMHNRQGKLTRDQFNSLRRSIMLHNRWYLPIGVLFISVTLLGLFQVISGWLSIIAFYGVLMGLIYSVMQAYRSFNAELRLRVWEITAPVEKYEQPYRVALGNEVFRVTPAQFITLEEGEVYTLYFARKSGYIFSIEVGGGHAKNTAEPPERRAER